MIWLMETVVDISTRDQKKYKLSFVFNADKLSGKKNFNYQD